MKRQSSVHFTVCASVLALLLPVLTPVTYAADQSRDQTRTQDRLQDNQIYGSQLMTPKEREEYRARLRAAKTLKERERIRAEHHERMKELAKKRGITLPDKPPSQGMHGGMGPGMGGGMGTGSGHRSGSGGYGY